MALPARTTSLLLVAAAMSLGLFAGHADAQWKWRDGSGRITVSDLPPPRGIPERDILQRPAPVAPAPAPAAQAGAQAGAASAPSDAAPAAPAATAAPASPGAPGGQAPGTDPELEARRRAAEQQEAARQREADARQQKVRAENCQTARNQLAALESGQRMVRFNDKGEREFIDDEQRTAATRRAQSVIANECR